MVMMPHSDFIVVGGVCLDRHYRLAAPLTNGAYNPATAVIHSVGGEAANTAKALLQWGEKVKVICNGLGATGQDNGPLEEFRRVCRNIVPISSPISMPECLILVDPAGLRTFSGIALEHSDYDEDKLNKALEMIRPGHWVTIDPNLGTAGEIIAKQCRSNENPLYLLDWDINHGMVDVCNCYIQTSTDECVGSPGNATTNLDFASSMARQHGCSFILTDGPSGSFVATPTGEVTHCRRRSKNTEVCRSKNAELCRSNYAQH